MPPKKKFLPPLKEGSQDDIASYETLTDALRSHPDISKFSKSIEAKNIAKLVSDIRKFQDKYLGKDTKTWPMVRLPDIFLRDRSSKGPLFTILLTIFSRLGANACIDPDSTDDYEKNCDTLKQVETELVQKGVLIRPIVYFDETVSTHHDQSELEDLVIKFGGKVVTDPTQASHVVAHDEEVDSVQAMATHKRKMWEKEFLRTVAVVKKQTKNPSALVHWWFWPMSSDEWMPAEDVAGIVEDPPVGPEGGPLVVACKFVRDVAKFNEWGVEADYAIEDYQEKVALYNGTTTGTKTGKKGGRRGRKGAKRGPKAKSPDPSAMLGGEDASKASTDAEKTEAVKTSLKRERNSTMEPRFLNTGYYGIRGEKIRHLVHVGALRMPSEALEILDDLMSYTDGWTKGGNKNTSTYELPGLDAVQRPSEDPENKSITVSELSLAPKPADMSDDQATALKTIEITRRIDLRTDIDTPERIRGGGGDGENDGNEPQPMDIDKPIATATSASTTNVADPANSPSETPTQVPKVVPKTGTAQVPRSTPTTGVATAQVPRPVPTAGMITTTDPTSAPTAGVATVAAPTPTPAAGSASVPAPTTTHKAATAPLPTLTATPTAGAPTPAIPTPPPAAGSPTPAVPTPTPAAGAPTPAIPTPTPAAGVAAATAPQTIPSAGVAAAPAPKTISSAQIPKAVPVATAATAQILKPISATAQVTKPLPSAGIAAAQVTKAVPSAGIAATQVTKPVLASGVQLPAATKQTEKPAAVTIKTVSSASASLVSSSQTTVPKANTPTGLNPAPAAKQTPAKTPIPSPSMSSSKATSTPVNSTAKPKQVVPLPKRPGSHWEQHIPGAQDDTAQEPQMKTPKPLWYDAKKISDFEEQMLPEWFDKSAQHRTPSSYLDARERIIEMSEKIGNRYLTATMIRRSIPGDAGSLLRMHSFLVAWGFINEEAVNDSAPTAPGIRELSGAVWRSIDVNSEENTNAIWTEQTRDDLISAVMEQSNKRQKIAGTAAPSPAFAPINWDAVAESVGNGASSVECEREFLALPLDGTSTNAAQVERSITPDHTNSAKTPDNKIASSSAGVDGTASQRAIKEQVIRELVDGARPEVVKAATDAAIKAAESLPEAQKASVLGIMASEAAAVAKKEEETVSRILGELMEHRMSKLENRLALLDDVEGMLEAERVALELERRDLYTARCRFWFQGN